MKIKIAVICLFLFSKANTQVKLEEIIKPGAKLHYLYYPVGSKDAFNLYITIKKTGAVPEFEWELDTVPAKSGLITHTPIEMKTGSSFYYFFREKLPKNKPGLLTLWLSQKLFTVLSKNAVTPVYISLYGKNKPPVAMGILRTTEQTSVLLDDEVVHIDSRPVEKLKRQGKKYVSSFGGSFSFYNSAKFPVIIRINADFNLELQEITTK